MFFSFAGLVLVVQVKEELRVWSVTAEQGHPNKKSCSRAEA
jgi:hypothetical protein